MLNKEFKRKDVERMRNLIKGNVNESAELQVGYTAKKESHKEGDIWEEGGKKWTIKDGIKQTYTRLDKVKKTAIMPLFCPCCGNIMKKRLDSKMYNLHQKCLDCVAKYESKLKMEGQFDDYVKNIKTKNALSYVDHLESYLLEALNTSNSQYVSEAGNIERWKGGVNKKKLKEEITKNISEFREEVKKIQNKK
jgi:hypothetical protein